MLRDMKTGSKVLAGFRLAMIVGVSVGVVGYRAVADLAGDIEEIGRNRLPSVRGVNRIAKGQLQIAYAERGLVNAKMMDAKS